MTLNAGSRLGPYEVLSPLGAGGMGEVWRARDTRLSREVAIKVLPVEVASDAARLKRFEREARAASALNHPNIVTIYEIGSSDSVSYIAMERVDGKTLRELLFGGALPIKKLLAIAAQIADGLAKAHEAGIVHRDLKPENLMVTKDGLVKILDFGLAKQTATGSGSDEGSHLPTETGTSPGMIVGTVGYMSPEQAAGQPLDFRSDQFAFGSILYEMATGKRAFQKSTAIDTLSAILHEEPKALAEANPEALAPLRWIVERCLAKEPERRYAATRDLARDLETVRDRSSETIGSLASAPPRPGGLTWFRTAIFGVALLAAGLLAGRLFWNARVPSPPTFQRLTFRRGFIDGARFSPDGRTVVYSARWDGEPPHLFMTRPESPTSQRLGLPDASLLSMSPQGELAIVAGKMAIGEGWWYADGTLATAPIAGGAPRELATNVQMADWAPDGKRMAVIRGNQLEFPLGRVIYKPGIEIVLPRISPAGDRIAFLEGVTRVRVVDLAGKEVFLSRDFDFIIGLAWSPSSQEIWVTSRGTLTALSLSGKERLLLRMPGGLGIDDISRDGRVLMTAGRGRREAWSQLAGQSRETEITVLAGSDAMGLAADGKSVLINDGSAFYLRRMDESEPRRLGEGTGSELSSDGKWVVVVRAGPPSRLVLVPTGPGEEKSLENGGIEQHEEANVRWSADGRWILFGGREKGHTRRMYLQDISGGRPIPVTPEGLHPESTSISADGRFVIVEQEGGFFMYPRDGGPKRLVRGLKSGREFVWRNWSEDGKSVFAWNNMELPFRVDRVDLETGVRTPWKTILPRDTAGLWNADLLITPDGQSYVYNCARQLQDLFLVDGLK